MRIKRILKTDIEERYELFYKGKEFFIQKSDRLKYPDKYYVYVKIGYNEYKSIGGTSCISKPNLRRYLNICEKTKPFTILASDQGPSIFN